MSFTPFNAPVQSRPVTLKRDHEAKGVDMRVIKEAFEDEEDLIGRLVKLGERDPFLVTDISKYVLSLRRALSSASQASTSQSVVTSQFKKRKLDDGSAVNGSTGSGAESSWADVTQKANHVAGDVSFSVPQRKKLRLEWISSIKETGGIRAVGADGGVEFGCGWGDVGQILCLPVPEKTKRQYNFVVIPTSVATESIIWTVFEPTKKESDAGANEEPAYTADLLNAELKRLRKKVVLPDENEFASAIVQSHRKDEKAFHVKAHRGAKDGYLYFLPPGIFWGFKKPLLFLPFSSIISISYTSVLQRTFNLNIQTIVGAEGVESEEIEFSMLDQLDFAGIDQYVKRHGLNDASLATQRRAKKYGVNDPKVKKEGNGTGPITAAEAQGLEEEDEDEESELQKCERALQDEEDELEEDYVDEDVDDDGSGSSGSDEEDYDGVGGEEEVFDEEQEFAAEEDGYGDEG